MSLPMVFRDEAQSEFDEAVDWYERQRGGLGFEFIEEVQKTLDQIVLAPQRCPFIFEDAKLALVRRFPYLVIYRIEATEIVILAVFHQRRDPLQWQVRV